MMMKRLIQAYFFSVLDAVSGDHALTLLTEFVTQMAYGTGTMNMVSDFEIQSVKLSGDYSSVSAAVWLMVQGLSGLAGPRRKSNG